MRTTDPTLESSIAAATIESISAGLAWLEIVTNLHAKRRTEQMVLFDAGTRFYGADANSLAARKPNKTPQSMSVFLGRNHDHPSVQVGAFIFLFIFVFVFVFISCAQAIVGH